jgi:hypothetical protein
VALETLKVFEGGSSSRDERGQGAVLKWVQGLREEQEKTTREEARKEEILQMLGELAKLAEHQRYPSVHPLRA